MSEVKFLEDASGPSGDLATLNNQLVPTLNGTLTRMMDSLHGPDGTDTFDASCNTCKHFQRTPFDRKTHNPNIFGFPGQCLKFDRKTTGWPRGQMCSFENEHCYENRRTGRTPADIYREMEDSRDAK